jgi:4-hydroxy-tetrahydrodipicolinate reductase
MQKIKYGIIGSSGRVGKEVKSLMDEYGNRLVFSYDVNGEWQEDIPQVLIDFSSPEAFDKSIDYASKFKSPLVNGTTGLKEEHINKLKKLAEKIPVVQSFNFSLGIQMLLKCTEILKEKLPDWDMEVSEIHHRFKKDKPSGTALMIKDTIGKDINISSLRLGNVAGEHTVYFGGLGEVISIKHTALSRRTFAEGAVKSAYFLLDKSNGFYTIKDVLFYS